MGLEFAFRAEDGTYHASPAEVRAYNLCRDAVAVFMQPPQTHMQRPQFPPLLVALSDKQLRDKLIALLARHGFVWEAAA